MEWYFFELDRQQNEKSIPHENVNEEGERTEILDEPRNEKE
jgi:hypothetical protein